MHTAFKLSMQLSDNILRNGTETKMNEHLFNTRQKSLDKAWEL